MCVESDWFWTTIVTGRIEPWLAESDGQNRVMLRAAASTAAAMSEGGYDTVLEGIIGPWMLPTVLPVLDECQSPVDYVVLRPDLSRCLERAAARPDTSQVAGHPPLRDSGPIRGLWTQFCDLGPLEAHAIDTTRLTPAETADQVAAARDAGRLTLDR